MVGVANPVEETPKTEMEELVGFLVHPNVVVRLQATQTVLSITADKDASKIFGENVQAITSLERLTLDTRFPQLCELAFKALINISALPDLKESVLNLDKYIPLLTMYILKQYPHGDLASMLLANVTRSEIGSRVLLYCSLPASKDQEATPTTGPQETPIEKLIKEFCVIQPADSKRNVDWLAAVFENISQHKNGRDILLGTKLRLFQRLVPFIKHQNTVRRGGVAGLIRNCSFHGASLHVFLENDDLLPQILLPLAGPEELEEEDMEGMPDDLQYLPADKTREPDGGVRNRLLETLQHLGVTREGRDWMRSKKVYPILRELHKWEQDAACLKTCEEVVQLLIGDETELGKNLLDVEIPENVVQKFNEIDLKEKAELGVTAPSGTYTSEVVLKV
eukprot:Colp12_sorted_trinity150504_noHs@5081